MRPYLDKDVATALRSAQRDGIDLGVLGDVARGARCATSRIEDEIQNAEAE
jgi:hypothetical protein